MDRNRLVTLAVARNLSAHFPLQSSISTANSTCATTYGLLTLSGEWSGADMHGYVCGVNIVIVLDEFDYNGRVCVCPHIA